MIIALLLTALLGLPQGATVSGSVLDREGKPLANATVIYTNIGSFSGVGDPRPGALGHVTKSGTGRTYKARTDKKGQFVIVGVVSGAYQVEITDAAGGRLYSGQRSVTEEADTSHSNVLNVDLSAFKATGGMVADVNELAANRRENTAAAQINDLLPQLHSALDARAWPQAVDILHQLIALDPNRWEFYQNLGTAENNLLQYADSAQHFQRAIDLVQKLLAGKPGSAQIKSDLSGLMISEADALHRLNKLDDAMKLYDEAAALTPEPAMAYYHACNAQSNRGSAAAAIELCKKAIAADHGQWEFYQTLATAQNGSGKYEDALASYESGIQTARQKLVEHPDSTIAKAGLGQMLNAEGNLYAQHTRYDQAIAAFGESAKYSSYAAMPLFNACATYYNMDRLTDAVAACDQAIAADPAMAEAYYIKASALFGRGSLDHGKYNVPDGTREAINKYLELSPFGEHAQYAREMLDKLDSTIETTVKSSKASKK